MLPASNEEAASAAFVFPGRAIPVNKMGSLIVLLLGLLEGIPVQSDLDANMAAGNSLQILRVTVEELVTNATLQSLASPDVDLDGDEIFEHVSAGILVDASRAELLP